jgi:hypothetical protein
MPVTVDAGAWIGQMVMNHHCCCSAALVVVVASWNKHLLAPEQSPPLPRTITPITSNNRSPRLEQWWRWQPDLMGYHGGVRGWSSRWQGMTESNEGDGWIRPRRREVEKVHTC